MELNEYIRRRGEREKYMLCIDDRTKFRGHYKRRPCINNQTNIAKMAHRRRHERTYSLRDQY